MLYRTQDTLGRIMPDRFGKPLRAGDKVVYDSPKYGLVTGVLEADEEDYTSIRVRRDSDNQVHFLKKTWRKDQIQPIMNMTEWFKDEVDRLSRV